MPLWECFLAFQRKRWSTLHNLQLLGLIANVVAFVPWCWLYMWPLQLRVYFVAHFKLNVDPIKLQMLASPLVLQHLAWVLVRSNLTTGGPFTYSEHEGVIFMDTSNLSHQSKPQTPGAQISRVTSSSSLICRLFGGP